MRKFTLIELVVIIAILALLVSILFPSIKNSRKASKAAVCLSNQKQIAVAMYSYAAANDGHFPYSPATPAASLSGIGHKPAKGRPTMEIIWKDVNQDRQVFICPLDPSPQDYSFWRFHQRPNFKDKNARASYMFNEWPAWMYAWHNSKQLKFSQISNISEWPLLSDGRIVVHGGEYWERGNILHSEWKAIDWNHAHHQIGMTYGDGHVKHINSLHSDIIDGRPEY